MTWVIIAIVLIVLIAIAATLVARRRRQQRTETLRERFGPEYDRTVEREGKQGRAEKDLERRAEQRDELQIRELDPAARQRFAHRWDEAQHLFVDDPTAAIRQADGLVHEVMRERGYPADDFERSADDLSVDHPHFVEHYRGAHGIASRAQRESISTEDQRQAMVHYRGLFDELLGGGSRAGAHGAAERGAVGYDSAHTPDGRAGASEGVREEADRREPEPQSARRGDDEPRSGAEPLR